MPKDKRYQHFNLMSPKRSLKIWKSIKSSFLRRNRRLLIIKSPNIVIKNTQKKKTSALSNKTTMKSSLSRRNKPQWYLLIQPSLLPKNSIHIAWNNPKSVLSSNISHRTHLHLQVKTNWTHWKHPKKVIRKQVPINEKELPIEVFDYVNQSRQVHS